VQIAEAILYSAMLMAAAISGRDVTLPNVSILDRSQGYAGNLFTQSVHRSIPFGSVGPKQERRQVAPTVVRSAVVHFEVENLPPACSPSSECAGRALRRPGIVASSLLIQRRQRVAGSGLRPLPVGFAAH
jgi:hypothetical protein